MSIQKLPTAILAGLFALIMPVVLNTVVVNSAIAQIDTDTDLDTDTDTDTDLDTNTDTDTDLDTDTSTPVGGIETGGGGTATDGINSALPITVGGMALLGTGAAAAYSRRRKK